MRHFWKVAIGVLVLTVVIAPRPVQGQFFMFENPLVGEPVPDFRLETLKSGKISLSEARSGKPSIIFFWATWCPHCRVQLQELKRSADELKRDGYNLILVDLGEDAGTVRAYMERNGLPFDVFLDMDTEVAGKYKIVGVPTFYFVDADGTVVAVEHSLPEDFGKMFSG